VLPMSPYLTVTYVSGLHPNTAQHAAAGDPRKEHAGAGFGQGSASERWNAVVEFLLKY
jgi:hypothetical protein